MYTSTVYGIDPCAAVFGVREWDKVMNHKHRTNISTLQCCVITQVLHAAVACMQQHGPVSVHSGRYYLVGARTSYDSANCVSISDGRGQDIKR